MNLKYSFKEHVSDLVTNLFVEPLLIYGNPILTKEEIAEEMCLFAKYNGLIK